MLNIGDLVTRKSHNNDVIFTITSITSSIAILKGVDIRLIADSNIDDLVKLESPSGSLREDNLITNNLLKDIKLDRDLYFYLPGKVLHIDSDKDYLKRCIKFYKDMKVEAYGEYLNEKDMPLKIKDLINKYKPSIVVITGHDALLKDNSYQNSNNFRDSVLRAREIENSHDKLIIIAGACQSNFEELIKAGANFASSPKRINIHALDPAIIASFISLSEINKDIDLIELLSKTKYGSSGIGGIITRGTMYVGFPR